MVNIHPSVFKVTKEDRIQLLNQQPRLIWFTGLSGSGKSTIANGLEAQLYELGFNTFLLDGDNMRAGLNRDLSFSDADRIENIRRIGEVSKLMIDAGLIVVSAFISPFISDRSMVGQLVGIENFLEIFVDCPIEVCEQRDVKGLYGKARQGLIPNFTGIDSPYQAPEAPFLTIKSAEEALEDTLNRLVLLLTPQITKK